MFTFATTQSPIVKLWRDGFVLYKNAFFKIWYVLLVLMLISGMLQYAVVLVPMDTLISSKYGFNWNAIFLGLVTTVGLMVQFYCIGLIFHRTYGVGADKDFKLSESMKLVRSRYLSICATGLAVFILVLIGAVALVIPGIFLAFALMFSVPAVICNHATAFKAIVASLKLVWGHWWRTFCVMLPATVVVYAIYVPVALFFTNEHSWITNAISVVVFTFLSSLVYAFILVQFNDLKLRAKKKQ